LPIGAAGTILTSDGDTADWVLPSGSGGYTQIATQNMAGLNTVTFSAIPQDYLSLFVEFNGLYVGTADILRLRYNGVTSTYQTIRLRTDGTTILSSTGTSGFIVDLETSSTRLSSGTIECFNYTGSNAVKKFSTEAISAVNTRGEFNFISNNSSTPPSAEFDAVTSLTIFTGSSNNITAGTITLYGGK
jgi:hypothetical protein